MPAQSTKNLLKQIQDANDDLQSKSQTLLQKANRNINDVENSMELTEKSLNASYSHFISDMNKDFVNYVVTMQEALAKE